MNDQERAQIAALRIGSIYEHYKTTPAKPMRYRIESIARHSETLELMVVYRALYDAGEHGQMWVRPLTMFLEDVEWHGKRIKRFTLLSQ